MERALKKALKGIQIRAVFSFLVKEGTTGCRERMRVLIIEEALEENVGHWPAYIGTIANGFRAVGDSVDILANRKCCDALRNSLQTIPYLTANCWMDSIYQGPLGGLRHSQLYAYEVKRWLARRPPYDWILVLTTRLQHLLAWTRLVSGGNLSESTRLLMLFVQGFTRYNNETKKAEPINGLTGRIARTCFYLLRPAVQAGQVFLGTETRSLQLELEKFSGLPARLFPHPIEMSGAPIEKPKGDIPKRIIGCPGIARHEKGTHPLQEAICEALKHSHLENLHFVLQWKDPIALPDGSTLKANNELSEHSRVHILRKSLSQQAFIDLLLASDLVLLPYRRDSYYNRLSRIAIEAIALGSPIIYTQGTAIEDLVEMCGGGGLPILEESKEGIFRAIFEGFNQLEKLRAEATANAERVRSYHSADLFRRCLLNISIG